MIKTNRKEVREKVKDFIIKNYNFEGYDIKYPIDLEFKNICNLIFKIFKEEKLGRDEIDQEINLKKNYNNSLFLAFEDWTAGLPSCLNCYYYLTPAKDIVCNFLQETEKEAEKYTEEQAENLITKLIFREIVKNI